MLADMEMQIHALATSYATPTQRSHRDDSDLDRCGVL